VLPALDVGKSVSRVGGKAQHPAYRSVTGDLKLEYAQFEEMETFARFGARLDADSQKVISHGLRIRACLKQNEFSPVAVPAQILVLLALGAKLFDSIALEQMSAAEAAVRDAAAQIPDAIKVRLETGEKLNADDRASLLQLVETAIKSLPNEAAEVSNGVKIDADTETDTPTEAKP
jgi:F-type H+-transporting ATPase subunit alpha